MRSGPPPRSSSPGPYILQSPAILLLAQHHVLHRSESEECLNKLLPSLSINERIPI
jgi:hypothetical protein